MSNQNEYWFAEDRRRKEYLMHYGVKGMKWGVRNNSRTLRDAHSMERYWKNRKAGRDNFYDKAANFNNRVAGKSKVLGAAAKTSNKMGSLLKKYGPQGLVTNSRISKYGKIKSLESSRMSLLADSSRKKMGRMLANSKEYWNEVKGQAKDAADSKIARLTADPKNKVNMAKAAVVKAQYAKEAQKLATQEAEHTANIKARFEERARQYEEVRNQYGS